MLWSVGKFMRVCSHLVDTYVPDRMRARHSSSFRVGEQSRAGTQRCMPIRKCDHKHSLALCAPPPPQNTHTHIYTHTPRPQHMQAGTVGNLGSGRPQKSVTPAVHELKGQAGEVRERGESGSNDTAAKRRRKRKSTPVRAEVGMCVRACVHVFVHGLRVRMWVCGCVVEGQPLRV